LSSSDEKHERVDVNGYQDAPQVQDSENAHEETTASVVVPVTAVVAVIATVVMVAMTAMIEEKG